MTTHGVFAAIGEPTRLRILMLLLERELCVCDLSDVLRLPQSTVSRHMSRLKSAGLVLSRRELTWIHYQLAPSELATDLKALLLAHLAKLEPYRSDRRVLATLLRDGRCAGAQR